MVYEAENYSPTMVLKIISAKAGKSFTTEQALINIIEKKEGENNEKENISPAA